MKIKIFYAHKDYRYFDSVEGEINKWLNKFHHIDIQEIFSDGDRIFILYIGSQNE